MPARPRAGTISGMSVSSPVSHPRLLTPLFLWQGGWLMALSSLHNQPHQHVAASLLVGLDKDIRVTCEGREENARAVLVAPECQQSLHSDGPVVILHLDPDEPAWRSLALQQPLPASRQQWLSDTLRSLCRMDIAAAQVATFLAQLRQLASPPPLDARIAASCAWLREAPEPAPTMATVAQQAGLSESRFRHLFREQTGVTFKRYLLHLKCQRALSLWHSGMNFTELAVLAGFYDQPHLNRTLRAMFDALPSGYARGQTVQVVSLSIPAENRTTPVE